MYRSGKVEVLHKAANGEEESCLILQRFDGVSFCCPRSIDVLMNLSLSGFFVVVISSDMSSLISMKVPSPKQSLETSTVCMSKPPFTSALWPR